MTRQRALAMACGLLVAAGCALVPGASPTQPPEPTAGPTSPPTAAPTASPALTPTPAGPSPGPSASPAAAATCPPGSADPLVPPAAAMTAAGVEPLAGRLGSYDYCDTSADAQPPARDGLDPLRLAPATGMVTVATADGTPFVGWRAGYTGDDPQADVLALGAGEPAAPLAEVTFRRPPTGDWLVVVRLDFGAEVGSAYYYWRVITP